MKHLKKAGLNPASSEDETRKIVSGTLAEIDEGKEEVARMDGLIEMLSKLQQAAAEAAWRDYGEIVVRDDDEEAAQASDSYAPEHLELQTANDEWFVTRLKNYGSPFVGEPTTVTFGDKCYGTNHILPTKGARQYTGGLSAHKLTKVVTTQTMTRDANRDVAALSARVSQLEGMEAHARTADARLRKYLPNENFPVVA